MSSTDTAASTTDTAYNWDGREHSYVPGDDWQERVDERLRFFSGSDPNLDPVTYEVIRNRLWTINMAHAETITRISGSPVLQALDFNMVILNARGETVMGAPFAQQLSSGAPLLVRYLMEEFADDPGILDGDIFVGNDPWIGANHQMDVLAAMPVFHEGELLAWVCNACHEIDLGGMVPGGWPQNSPDVFHDPVLFAPFKLVDQGVLRKDLARMYQRWSRFPDVLALDLRAQLSGCTFTRRELLDVRDRFGAATLRSAMDRVVESAQRAFVEKMSRIPDGRWTEVRYIDEAMPGDRRNYRLQTTVEKRGDRLIVENAGTDPQIEGPIGITYASFMGAVMAVQAITVLSDQMFSLGGAERQVDLRPTPGLLSCIDHPSSVSGGVVNVLTQEHLLMNIMGRMMVADPELKRDVISGGPEWTMVVLVGENDRGQLIGTALTDALAQGSGARSFKDGIDTSAPAWSPMMALMNVEMIEQFFPIVYLYRRELVDGGGAGRWRGGTGMDFSFFSHRARALEAITNVGGTGVSTPSGTGLFGGYASPTAQVRVAKGTNLAAWFAERRLPGDISALSAQEEFRLRCKSNGTHLLPGDVVESRFAGGAGYGDPLRREPERVGRDVENEYVSLASAHDIYGVVVNEAGTVDAAGTTARRTTLLAERAGWGRADELPHDPAPEPSPPTGEPPRPVHENVVSRDGDGQRVLACADCDTVLSDHRDNYMAGCLVHEAPITAIPLVQDPAYFLDDVMVLRQFCCPGCQVLLATQTLRASEPLIPEMLLA